MPSSYAHHRFGTQVLQQIPAKIRDTVLCHQPLFHAGLQGPDFLFFHSFIKKTPLFHLGHLYHERSGQDFFTGVCAHLKAHPSKAASAYLYGLLAHYCLDTGCHPFVYDVTDATELDHSELETEFDRYLMALDGIKKPHETNISPYWRLNRDEYNVVAGFFPEVSPKDAAACIRSMALAQRLLTIPTAAGHGAVVLFTQLAGGNTRGKVMSVGPDPRCCHLNSPMLEHYEQARAKFPLLLDQLNHHLAYGKPFGNDFKPNFNRG